MDITATGITGGILAAVVYTVVRGIRQRSFEIGAMILIFLAGFSIPGGVKLIYSAWTGNQNTLPSSWREYVAVAGIAVIGLAAHFLIQSFRNVWPKRASIMEPDELSGNSTDSRDRKSTRLNSSHIQKSRMPSSA